MKLPTLDEMQSEKLLKSHRAGPLVSFKYPKKNWGKGWKWNNTTLEARGIVYDTRTGECICRPFRKFFNAKEKECHASLAESSLTVKLDGTCIVAYPFDDQVCCKTLGSFANEHISLALPLVQRAIGNLVVNGVSWLGHTTPIFELLSNIKESGVKSGSNVIEHIGPAKIVLLGVRDINTGNLWSYSTLRALARQLQVELVAEARDLNALNALRISVGDWDGVNEGWVGIDNKQELFKIKFLEYTAAHKQVSKISQHRYQAKRSRYFQSAVSFMLNHPELATRVYDNWDDIMGQLNPIVTELEHQLEEFNLSSKPHWVTISRKEKKKRLKTVPRDLHELIFQDNVPKERKRELLLKEAAWRLDNPRKSETKKGESPE